MGSIVHRSVPWSPNCSHAHALFQDRFKDVQVGSRWFSTLDILSPNFHTAGPSVTPAILLVSPCARSSSSSTCLFSSFVPSTCITPKGCKRLMSLLLAANNQATRRNEIIRSYFQVGSSSNRYAPRLPQQETKSSTKQQTFSNPVEGTFLLFRFVWWLDCLLLKEGASAFCSLKWLLEVFLAVAEFVGFREGGRLPFEWLYWILYCPLLAPIAPLDSYRSLQPRKNYDLFSQSRY